MHYNASQIGKDGCNCDGAMSAGLSVFQVMPREMYFGVSRATSIDLCVRDLVMASRFRAATKIFAEAGGEPFTGFTVDRLPQARYAATTVRAKHVARVAHRERPDVIIVQQHLPTAAAIARLLPQVKVILHRHNFPKSYDIGNTLRVLIRRAVGKRRYARLAGFIHVSQACADAFTQAWPDVAAPSCVVNNGLDFDAWQPAPDRTKEILCVSRCDPEKGILEAAQGLAVLLPKFPEWQARFILSATDVYPEYFQRVQATLSGLGAQAAVEVQRPFAEVKAAVERAAIALVPSKWIEPFGRAALEAHAGGAAVISSGTGGLAEVSGETALMLPTVTADAIAAAIETLIRDEALRERLAQKGMERARGRFDIRTQAARLDAFCHAVARGGGQGVQKRLAPGAGGCGDESSRAAK